MKYDRKKKEMLIIIISISFNFFQKTAKKLFKAPFGHSFCPEKDYGDD